MKKNKVLIVVPYADFFPEQKRSDQLREFVRHFNEIKNINILIAEQTDPLMYFNRGQVINAGIKWFVSNISTPKYLVLHDVDMLPDKVLLAEYLKAKTPTSFVPFDDEFKQIYFEKRLDAGGGIFGISYTDFIKVNGYPNNFWSWGGEDNAFNNRLLSCKIKWTHIDKGRVKHTDQQRKSHKTKMDYLRENKLRSMMTSENIRADIRDWKKNGITQTKVAVDGSYQQSSNIYHVKLLLSKKYLAETLRHNNIVYKNIQKSGGSDSTILILIPYADFYPEQRRSEEIKLSIDHFTKLLKKQQSKSFEIKVLVCEQVMPQKYFNKGQLLNLGVKWYCDRNAYPTYLIFNDMDMLPNKTLFGEYIKFALAKFVANLTPFDECSKKIYGDDFWKNICAGVFGISYKDFVKINGFPNKMWLWGGEDNIVTCRIKRLNIQYHFVKKGKIKHIDTIRKSQDKNRYLQENKLINYRAYSMLKQDKNDWERDGYANVSYRHFEEKKLNKYVSCVEFELNEYFLKEILEYNNIKPAF